MCLLKWREIFFIAMLLCGCICMHYIPPRDNGDVYQNVSLKEWDRKSIYTLSHLSSSILPLSIYSIIFSKKATDGYCTHIMSTEYPTIQLI